MEIFILPYTSMPDILASVQIWLLVPSNSYMILPCSRDSHSNWEGTGSGKGAQVPPSTMVTSYVPAGKISKRSITWPTKLKELVGSYQAPNSGGEIYKFCLNSCLSSFLSLVLLCPLNAVIIIFNIIFNDIVYSLLYQKNY